ncbi:hypothetical protein KRX57_01815 [Weeksellaceae bacterium TAE3-ERU29]|nr:hypothetical protein [Weeksellaceae bacterium TAE3-ERU29]
MSANGKNNIQKIGAWWPLCSMFLFFLGAIFTVSLQQTSFKNLGLFSIIISGISLVTYFIFTLGYILFTGDKSLNKVFITVYLSTSILMILGGLVYALLGFPYGLNVFILGIGMMIIFWLGVLIYFIFFSKAKNR